MTQLQQDSTFYCLVVFLEHDWLIFPYDLGMSTIFRS